MSAPRVETPRTPTPVAETWMRPIDRYRKTPFTHEDAAWRAIAMAFAERPRDPIGTGTHHGLCAAVGLMYWRGQLTDAMAERMRVRIHTYVGHGGYAYEPTVETDWTVFVPHREARCLAALWLALDSQRDP